MVIIKSMDYKKRFGFYDTRLNKTSDTIKTNLLIKYDLLVKQINILKNKKKLKETDYEDFLDINKENIMLEKLDDEINYNEDRLNKIIQNNIKLLKNRDLKININEIEKITITINGIKKYYNTLCIKYNKYLHKFPSKYYGKIKKYQEKKLYEIKQDKLKVLDD